MMRLILASVVVLPLSSAPPRGQAPSEVRLPRQDAVRLAEAYRLAETVQDEIWPNWSRTAMPLLLVRDSAEFLIDHPHPSAEFRSLGYDLLVQREVWTRPPQFAADLLATFPAVGGLPTIVIGTPERTGKSSTAWVLTVLHEHFHQWQYSQPGYYSGVAQLELARGDSTGRWMLDYPFPYDSHPVQRSVRRWAGALAHALDSGGSARSLTTVMAERDALRAGLRAADYRYLEFQLWQEGVARFIECAAASAAARRGEPSAAFRTLPDYEPYGAVAAQMRRRLRRELGELSLGRDRRVSFYSLGAATALLLEQSGSVWKEAYADRPFMLTTLLPASP